MTPVESAPPGDALAAPPRTTGRRYVFAWSLWDWGSAAYNSIVTTFIFANYLTKAVASGAPPGSLSGPTLLGVSTACGGVVVALTAPVTGQRADAGGRRRRNLAVCTAVVIACAIGLFFVRQQYSYLFFGLTLMAVGSVFMEFAGVSYNAMLRQVSTRDNIGRVSGFGWSMGYFGGIVVLLIALVGFVLPDVGWFGVTAADGLKYRATALFVAVWFAVFAIPVLVTLPETPRAAGTVRVGFFASYKVLVYDVVALFRRDPHAVWFLVASAVYRDGLTAVFSFGAVLAVSVYGLTPTTVIIFGVAANLVAAVGAVVGGRVEDRVGPKPVILTSLTALVTTALILLFCHGSTLFWIFGLLLCLWVGPAQSSSRTFLARVAPVGREGEMFGLYATTGRAATFLAPALFALISGVFSSNRLGILGIALVLAVGALVLVRVPPPPRTQPQAAPQTV